MKSLLFVAVLAVVAYAAWDLFGDSVTKSFRNAADSAKEQIGGLVPGSGEADFELNYDGRVKKFTVTSRHQPEMAVRTEVELLARYLRTQETLVPHVRVIYDASSFATPAEQTRFEAEVRRQLEQANARASFVVSGSPRAR